MTTRTEMRDRSLQGIKAAALELFVTKGYLGTPLREIAAKAGCAKATLYHYFSAKSELALELYRSLYADLTEQETSIMGAERSTRERIHRLVKHFFEWAEESPQALLYIYDEFPRLAEYVDMPELELTTANMARRLIVEGQAANDVKGVSADILGWSFVIPLDIARAWAQGYIEGDLVTLADETAEMIWGAIRADPRGSRATVSVTDGKQEGGENGI